MIPNRIPIPLLFFCCVSLCSCKLGGLQSSDTAQDASAAVRTQHETAFDKEDELQKLIRFSESLTSLNEEPLVEIIKKAREDGKIDQQLSALSDQEVYEALNGIRKLWMHPKVVFQHLESLRPDVSGPAQEDARNLDRLLSLSEAECGFSPKTEFTETQSGERFLEFLKEQRLFDDLAFDLSTLTSKQTPATVAYLLLHIPVVHRLQWFVVCAEFKRTDGFFAEEKMQGINGAELYKALSFMNGLDKSEFGSDNLWGVLFDLSRQRSYVKWQSKTKRKFVVGVYVGFSNPLYWAILYQILPNLGEKILGMTSSTGSTLSIQELLREYELTSYASLEEFPEEHSDSLDDRPWEDWVRYYCAAHIRDENESVDSGVHVFGLPSAAGFSQAATEALHRGATLELEYLRDINNRVEFELSEMRMLSVKIDDIDEVKGRFQLSLSQDAELDGVIDQLWVTIEGNEIKHFEVRRRRHSRCRKSAR